MGFFFIIHSPFKSVPQLLQRQQNKETFCINYKQDKQICTIISASSFFWVLQRPAIFCLNLTSFTEDIFFMLPDLIRCSKESWFMSLPFFSLTISLTSPLSLQLSGITVNLHLNICLKPTSVTQLLNFQINLSELSLMPFTISP